MLSHGRGLREACGTNGLCGGHKRQEWLPVNAVEHAALAGIDIDTLIFDEKTVSLLDRRKPRENAERQRRTSLRRRGWLIRRALLCADVLGVVAAFFLAKLVAPGSGSAHPQLEVAVLLLLVPVWVVAAKLYGLYDNDAELVDHSTVDEVVGVFHLVTLGVWFYFVLTWAFGLREPHV